MGLGNLEIFPSGGNRFNFAFVLLGGGPWGPKVSPGTQKTYNLQPSGRGETNLYPSGFSKNAKKKPKQNDCFLGGGFSGGGGDNIFVFLGCFREPG